MPPNATCIASAPSGVTTSVRQNKSIVNYNFSTSDTEMHITWSLVSHVASIRLTGAKIYVTLNMKSPHLSLVYPKYS